MFDPQCLYDNDSERAGLVALAVAAFFYGIALPLMTHPEGGRTLASLEPRNMGETVHARVVRSNVPDPSHHTWSY